MSPMDHKICDKCLNSATTKITSYPQGAECKICTRPFTVLRWRSSDSGNGQKTIVCSTCANHKSCCQSCMLDRHYHIPIEIRDTALRMAGMERYIPGSTTRNRELKQRIANKLDGESYNTEANDLLSKLAKKLVDSEQKKLALGAEIGPDDVLFLGKFVPPIDTSVKSFFVFGFPPSLSSTTLHRLVPTATDIQLTSAARCGFITFANRKSAEAFANQHKSYTSNVEAVGPVLLILKYPMRISWSPVFQIDKRNQQKWSQKASNTMAVLAKKNASTNKSSGVGKVTKPLMKKKGHYTSIGDEL